MAAHRYWRIRFLAATETFNRVRIAEAEMMITPGGADQCTGGTASSSSGTAANAFDNNTGTECDFGISDASPTLKYDFGVGVTKDIVEYTIRATATFTGTWVLESSDNDSSWTIEDRKSQVLTSSTTFTFSVTGSSFSSKSPLTPYSPGITVSWWSGTPQIKGMYPKEIGGSPSVVPTWEGSGGAVFPVPTDGTIVGTVTEGGIAVPYAIVHCYFRPTGALIASAICSASGSFTFSGLDPTVPGDADNGKYFVVALDPAGGNRYNALIYDRVVPS